MPLITQINSLATRIGTEFKTVGGRIGTLANLNTTDKTSLVNAINSVVASAGATNLDALTDVVISAPATGHVLRHDGTQFVNVQGTVYYEQSGAAAAAQAASQPRDTDLDAIAALSTSAFGRGLLTLANAAGLTAALDSATTALKGAVLLASVAEAQTGADTGKAVTSAGVKGAIDQRIDNNAGLGSSTTNAPSQAAAKAYADALLDANNAYQYKGVVDASTNPNYPAASAGWTYKISVAGRIGGASGVVVEVGDTITCLVDGTASGTQAAVGANWIVAQTNLDGAVIGPVSSTAGNLTSFNGTTGKVVQDSGRTFTDTVAANGNLVSGNAVVNYAQVKDQTLTALAGLTTAANQLILATGVDTFSMLTTGATGRALLADATPLEARTEIDVYSKTEIGNPETDFVATFNTALA